jgi:uncharacterized protein YkwD
MRNPGHRRILLDPGYDTVGLGVARGALSRGAGNALTAVLVAAETR